MFYRMSPFTIHYISFSRHPGKTTAMSSIYDPLNDPKLAIDNVYVDESSLVHSQKEANPWWRVNLEEVHCIWALRFLNRALGK